MNCGRYPSTKLYPQVHASILITPRVAQSGSFHGGFVGAGLQLGPAPGQWVPVYRHRWWRTRARAAAAEFPEAVNLKGLGHLFMVAAAGIDIRAAW